ncbi:hypothetical protein R4Z09_26405 [Niallia oryzisoli]|uniref:TcaA protein NTF2-like domain-containing protein n=1 Tax=Niallia oryzisoli TaxID=1737571 RepID=A0ABZ2CEN2_9BACI
MKKQRGFVMLLVLFFMLAGCSDKETSSEEPETEEATKENVQDQGAANDPDPPKETTPNDEGPKQTIPKTENPKGDTPTVGGGKPAAPPSSETETETVPVTEDPAVPATIPSAAPQEGPTELEEQQMTMLMDEYMANYLLAVNEGAFIYIMHLIDPASAFYNEQVDYVLETYNRNIKETLLYYEISSITPVGEDTYHITVQESFGVYFGNEDREQVMDFENVYTVKKFQYGVFLITDLQVTSKI